APSRSRSSRASGSARWSMMRTAPVGDQAMAWTLMDLNITRNAERGTLARRSPRLFRVPRSDFRVFVVPFLPTSYDTLLFETRDAVAFITINRPDKLNALNDQVTDDLPHAADGAATAAGIQDANRPGAARKG